MNGQKDLLHGVPCVAIRHSEPAKKEDTKYHEEMSRLYRQHVLKEQPTLQIQGLGGGGAKKKQDVAEVVHKPTI